MFASRIDDVRSWIALAADGIPPAEAATYCDFLDEYRKSHHDWFLGELAADVSLDGDFQSHNSVFANGTLSLMDTFPPKEAWLVGHKMVAAYRMGTDLWALTGKKEIFDAFIEGYEKGSGSTVNRKLDEFLPLYVATISAPYLYILLKTNSAMRGPAEKYHQFMRERLADSRVK